MRAFAIARGALSPCALDELRVAVNTHRPSLEVCWRSSMVNQRRLDVTLSGSVITFTAYPDSPQQFVRRLDLRRWFPGAYAGHRNWDEYPPLLDWDYGNGLLAVGDTPDIDTRNHIDVDFLFED